MNGIDFLADTNFLIYLSEGRPEAALFADYSFAVSFITEIELLGRVGLTDEEAELIRRLLDSCVIIDLASTIKEKAIRLKQVRKIKLPDALVGATAQQFGLTLLFQQYSRTRYLIIDAGQLIRLLIAPRLQAKEFGIAAVFFE